MRLQDFRAAYGQGEEVLKGLSAEWGEAEIVGLIGLNGAGKSTLLKAMAQLIPYSGSLTLEGKELSRWDARQRSRRVGYLPQATGFHQAFTVYEVIEMARFSFGDRWGRSRASGDSVERCLRRLDVWHLRDRLVPQLSGGEAQRIRLAQLLAQEADWLLLDEPTSALDLSQQAALEKLLGELREEGKSLLLASHDFNLLRRVASRLWLLHQGSLALEGVPDELLRHPEFVRVFQVEMEFFSNSEGSSVVYPRIIPREI